MVKEYDSLNNLVGEGSYLNGKKHGPWIEYDKYGRNEGNYENGIRVGHWKRYRDSGLLWSEGPYCNGIKQGTWKDYYPSGNLRTVYDVVLDYVKEGNFTLYYDNKSSIVQCEGEYEENCQHGLWKFYDKSGTLVGQAAYDMDELIEEKITGIKRKRYANGFDDDS